MTPENFYKFLRETCFFLGFFSISASLFYWLNPIEMNLNKLNQNDIAIFIGLWTPTFFILSSIFNRIVEKLKKK
jgi:hypothetical protein